MSFSPRIVPLRPPEIISLLMGDFGSGPLRGSVSQSGKDFSNLEGKRPRNAVHGKDGPPR